MSPLNSPAEEIVYRKVLRFFPDEAKSWKNGKR
jgi:hypothetical protein